MVAILILALIGVLVGVGLLVKSFFTMKKDEKKATKMICWAFVLYFVAFLTIAIFNELENGSSSSWNSLSDSEKKWYRENYGNGVDYDDIIDDYKDKYFK